jgi:UPF0042 nucleotide-binding protein
MSEAGVLKVVIVTGLSGAGKLSILRVLEDLGYETMDNPPLTALDDLVRRAEQNLAIGLDARSRGFSAEMVLSALAQLRETPTLAPSLVYATASDDALLRRYSESRRRHPLAQGGAISTGIALERSLTAPLAAAADLRIDTTDLALPRLRALIEDQFGGQAPDMALTLLSFSYAVGLPSEADLVFDARFLRNPHYDPDLRPLCGLDPEIADFLEQDPDFVTYFTKISGLLEFLLPRFVQEGKKYATICVGCTGGQHRSVYMIEKLNSYLAQAGWRASVKHREAAKFMPRPLTPSPAKE